MKFNGENLLEIPMSRRGYKTNWKLELPWIIYDQDLDAVFCSDCKQAQVSKCVFNSTGYVGGNIQMMKKSDLVNHSLSVKHKAAVEKLSRPEFRAEKVRRIDEIVYNQRQTQFERKAAIVTGASRGLGREIAVLLARMGIRVIVNYNQNDADAFETVRKVADAGGNAVVYKSNIGDPQQVRQLVQFAINTFGSIDIVVNNATSFIPKSFLLISDAEIDQMVNVNLKGVIYMCRACAPLIKAGGTIINITSNLRISNCQGSEYAIYSATKAAVDEITRQLCRQLAPLTTINSIAVGAVETEEFLVNKSHMLINKIISTTPMQRLGRVSDVTRVVKFLVSEDARWITGQTIPVDGGFCT